VRFGNVRLPESITEFSASGENGLFTDKPEKGSCSLPVGKYRINDWGISRKDDKTIKVNMPSLVRTVPPQPHQKHCLTLPAPQSDPLQAMSPHSVAHGKCVYGSTIQSDGLELELVCLDVDLAEMIRFIKCNNVRMPVLRRI
jgi:hypothetical protein